MPGNGGEGRGFYNKIKNISYNYKNVVSPRPNPVFTFVVLRISTNPFSQTSAPFSPHNQSRLPETCVSMCSFSHNKLLKELPENLKSCININHSNRRGKGKEKYGILSQHASTCDFI